MHSMKIAAYCALQRKAILGRHVAGYHWTAMERQPAPFFSNKPLIGDTIRRVHLYSIPIEDVHGSGVQRRTGFNTGQGYEVNRAKQVSALAGSEDLWHCIASRICFCSSLRNRLVIVVTAIYPWIGSPSFRINR